MARKQAAGGTAAQPQKTSTRAAKPKAEKPKKVKPSKVKEETIQKFKVGTAARAALQAYKGADPADQTVADTAWTAHRQVLQKANDRDDLIVAGMARSLVVGIPLPALSLKYLVQSSVLPVGRLYQIIGLEGSCKSSLLADMMRWVLINLGYGMVYEVEAKDIAELREAIWEYNPVWLNVRALIHQCSSMDSWMKSLETEVDEVKKYNEGYGGSPGVGWRNPYIYGVDSFTAAATEETIDKLGKEGPGRGHPMEANYISQYGRSLPDKLRGTSIIIAGTNHLKPKRDDRGNEISNSPGGRAFKFMESTEIEMAKQSKYKLAQQSGVWLRIKTMKNSLGEGGKAIRATLVWDWRWNEKRQDWLQHAAFDWHSATVEMLRDFETDKNSKATWNAICDIIDINTTKSGRFWSPRLGIPEDKAVPRHEFGRAIDYDGDLQTELYPILGITRRSVFRPNVPLRETIRIASAEADAQLPNYYEQFDRDLNEFAEVTEALHQSKPQGPDEDEVA
jgi:hypothetical protein